MTIGFAASWQGVVERTAEDAKACVRMAFDMQRRLAELNAKWRSAGVENPFRVRMGINNRMDYTIIGAEANLAARLQSIVGPGHIVISYETYALARDILVAQALSPIQMKGISREGRALCGQRHARFHRRARRNLQRTHDRP